MPYFNSWDLTLIYRVGPSIDFFNRYWNSSFIDLLGAKSIPRVYIPIFELIILNSFCSLNSSLTDKFTSISLIVSYLYLPFELNQNEIAYAKNLSSQIAPPIALRYVF